MTQEITALVNRTLVLFPVRVWRYFLDKNGFLLAAGMSYQALFAVFAAVYVGFTIVVLWFGARSGTLAALAALVNTVIPGLIGPDGAVTTEQLADAASASFGVLTWTGVIALGGLVWTAIGWVTFSRMAVRTVLGLKKDRRNYVILKARDLLAAIGFGVVLLVASALSVASTAALGAVFEVIGLSTASGLFTAAVRIGGLVLVYVIDVLVLAVMFRFLSSAAIRWRRLWGGSLLGGAALVGLQVLSSILVGGVGNNPLLATFAVFIGLLLYFRIASVITLVAGAWIAVGAQDRDEPLRRVSQKQLQRERELAELRALLLAADVRVREARDELEHARWWERPAASVRLRSLQREREEMRGRAAPDR